MGAHESYTRLLGLALRGGNLVTGSDAAQGAAHAGTARLLLLSADASVRTCKDAAFWAERGNCLLIVLPCDKATLGEALGRGTVAVAALTDAGLAAAVGERLAQFDSERYGAMAERLRLKSKRAGERRAARARNAPRKPATRPDGDATRKPGAARPHGDAATRPDGDATRKTTATRPGKDSARKPATRPGKDSARKPAARPGKDSARKLAAQKSAAPRNRNAKARSSRKK